jgi:arabinogalactan oligomer/maltooligosaccharide transport system substrate-binding protein
MKKSLLTLISILLVAAFVLAACGTPAEVTEEAKATVAPAAATPIEVTFWHAYGTGSAEEAALTKVLAQAAIDLPQYKINVLQVPFADIYNKYRTDVAAGGGPDMFIAPNDSFGDDARAGLIADITDLTKGKLDGVGKLGVDGMSLDGKLYGPPPRRPWTKSKLPWKPAPRSP